MKIEYSCSENKTYSLATQCNEYALCVFLHIYYVYTRFHRVGEGLVSLLSISKDKVAKIN